MFPPGRASRFPGPSLDRPRAVSRVSLGDALAVSPRSRLLRPESRRRSPASAFRPSRACIPGSLGTGQAPRVGIPGAAAPVAESCGNCPRPARRQAPESRLETLFPGRPPGGPDAEPCAPKHISGRRRSSGLRGPAPGPSLRVCPRPASDSRQTPARQRLGASDSAKRPSGPNFRASASRAALRPEPRPALPASAAPGFLWDRPPARPSRPTFRNRSPHPRSERRSARIPGPRPH